MQNIHNKQFFEFFICIYAKCIVKYLSYLHLSNLEVFYNKIESNTIHDVEQFHPLKSWVGSAAIITKMRLAVTLSLMVDFINSD